jgi:L-fuculose-phosphate aldolase
MSFKMENLDDIKQQIMEGGQRLLKEGLVARTWGNISIRVDSAHMLITPSGRPYEELTEADIVLVNYHTSKHEGSVKPSSEKGLHCEIYRTRKEISAVIHTHQMNASTVAAAHREVPPILDDMTQIIGPSVRVADYALPSTKKITKKTVQALKGRNAALMANHGAVCVGRDLEEAFVVCQVLEKACKAFIEAEFLGGAKSINKFEASLMHQFYLRKYSAKAKKNK